jgi:hypothetical protein
LEILDRSCAHMSVVDTEARDWCGAGGVVWKVFDAELEHAAALVFRGGDDCYYADRIPSLRAVSAGPVDDEVAVVGLSSCCSMYGSSTVERPPPPVELKTGFASIVAGFATLARMKVPVP